MAFHVRYAAQQSKPLHLKNPLRRLVVVLAGLTVLIFGMGLALLPLGKAGMLGCAIVGIVGVLMALGTWSTVARRREVDCHLVELEEGNYLARWTYTLSESQRFGDSEWEQARQTPWILTLILLGLGGLMGAAVLLAGAAPSHFFLWAGGGAVVGAIFDLLFYFYEASRCRRLREGLGAVYIGRNGLYFADRYESWDATYQRLTGLELEEGEQAILVFTYLLTGGKNGPRTKVVRVPVPMGEESTARDLVRRLMGGGMAKGEKRARRRGEIEVARDRGEYRSRVFPVRWSPSAAQWERFARKEAFHGATFLVLIPILLGILGLLPGFVVGLLIWIFAGNGAAVLWGMLVGAAAGAILGLLPIPLLLYAGWKESRALLAQGCEVSMDEEGITYNGEQYPWKSSTCYLEKVSLEPGDSAVLDLRFFHATRRSIRIRIPVPHGQEAEAWPLLERLDSLEVQADS